MGHCFCCPHTMGSPCGVWERAKNWGAFRHLFVNLISTTVRHPVDYKHTEDWVCGNPKQRVLCKQKKHCPIPFPLPLFSPWAGQQLKSLPMGEKRGRGKGMGHCFCCPHTMGSPCEDWETAKICAEFSHLFCQSDKHKSQTPSRLQSTLNIGVCGNPKQRVLCKQKHPMPHPLPPSPFLTMGRPTTQEPAHG